MHNYKDLGGIVKGKRRTYRIEVNVTQPSPDVFRIEPIYEVSVFDNGTNEFIKKELVEVPGDSRQILFTYINLVKISAENDFR